jgi:molecular chaperone GrpE
VMIPVLGPEEDREQKNSTGENEAENIQTSVEGYIDQLQRLKAEFSNYKKRINEERKSLFSVAKSDLILRLLPVLDDFERMIDHHDKDGKCHLDGVKLIYQNLKKIMIDEGLEEVISVGEPFDPNFHEAVGVEETSSDQEGVVVEEWKKGYRFGGRLLRPSQVKVGKYVEKAGDG